MLIGAASAIAQASPSAPSQLAVSSMADALAHSPLHQLHILYIHGIGDDGAGDNDSEYLRHGLCKRMKCTTRDGVNDGYPDFADQAPFQLGAKPPALTYLGQPIWRLDNKGSDASREWDASAPFFQRWKLVFTKGRGTVYVDELNWWPLVQALKCRQMVLGDADLVGPYKETLDDCSRPTTPDRNTPVQNSRVRFDSYTWLDQDQLDPLKSSSHHGAWANRVIKSSIEDWGFTDAILATGPLQPYLIEGLRQLIEKAVETPLEGATAKSSTDDLFIVTHSLGSWLVFMALDSENVPGPPEWQRNNDDLQYVLRRTSVVYYLANQMRLMEMSNLEGNSKTVVTPHLQEWVKARSTQLPADRSKDLPVAKIVAWSDPSDLLTWKVPSIANVSVENCAIRNTINWVIFENPTKAHDDYGLQRKVIDQMFDRKGAGSTCSVQQPLPQAVPPS
jgi:hypothetical protein